MRRPVTRLQGCRTSYRTGGPPEMPRLRDVFPSELWFGEPKRDAKVKHWGVAATTVCDWGPPASRGPDGPAPAAPAAVRTPGPVARPRGCRTQERIAA
jgi:hypothetical protein